MHGLIIYNFGSDIHIIVMPIFLIVVQSNLSSHVPKGNIIIHIVSVIVFNTYTLKKKLYSMPLRR